MERHGSMEAYAAAKARIFAALRDDDDGGGGGGGGGSRGDHVHVHISF